MNKKSNEIFFYAPLGQNLLPEKIGGAEVGCLKTLEIYKSAGYDITVLHKPSMAQGQFIYLLKTFFFPLRLIQLLLLHKSVPIHIVGFYRKIVYYEWLLMKISKCLKHKVIYELRNGSMISSYNEGGIVYRTFLKSLLLESDIVLCQGLDYVKFIQSKWGIERSYYPNYIMDEFIKPHSLSRSYPIRLIYFGRITKSKNIDVIIEILSYIRSAGIDAVLDLIGGYDKAYYELLQLKIKEVGLDQFCVYFYGRKSFSFISEKLQGASYFVFPSQESQEGHSNSLTEAMGRGVVPIVSTAGFNRSICGCQDLVVNSVNGKEFANKIIEIEDAQKWGEYSAFVYKRVLNNYTQSIVSKKLISYVTSL